MQNNDNKKFLHYGHTVKACFVAYIVQAIVNNFVPLLFLIFQSTYQIPLSEITLLITFNFVIQLSVDLLAARFVDKIGYRVSIVVAHIMSALGLVLLAVLPDVLPNAFAGLLLAVMVYAIGGGLLEVLVSPIVESCPTDNKETAMSMLHSFYCWGHVGVVLLSTLFFTVFGAKNWKVLALLWAAVPALNCLLFLRVPIYTLLEEGDPGLSMRDLFANKMFWVIMLLMVCAGASEQAVSQWASTFAESGLKVSKTVGDLAGPMFFAVLMGASRFFYGKYGERIDLIRFMKLSSVLCIFSYLLISLSPFPALSLVGCGLCGLSVGILWPGSFSIASQVIPRGGTVLFALLALGGDIGCSGGPTFAGMVSSMAKGDLHIGILAAVVFPILMLLGTTIVKSAWAENSKKDTIVPSKL